MGQLLTSTSSWQSNCGMYFCGQLCLANQKYLQTDPDTPCGNQMSKWSWPKRNMMSQLSEKCPNEALMPLTVWWENARAHIWFPSLPHFETLLFLLHDNQIGLHDYLFEHCKLCPHAHCVSVSLSSCTSFCVFTWTCMLSWHSPGYTTCLLSKCMW